MNKYYGQRETDKIIEQYFPGITHGFCIEVGAYDGIKGSNTKFFEDLGWDCLCVEPNPWQYIELKKNRQGPCLCCACDSLVGWDMLEIFSFQSGIQSSLTSLKTDPRLIRDYGDAITNRSKQPVPTMTLNFILAIFNISNIGFISIDTEGTEYGVLLGLNLHRYRPKLLVVEENYEEDVIIKHHLAQYGYKFDQRFFVNNFYIREE